MEKRIDWRDLRLNEESTAHKLAYENLKFRKSKPDVNVQLISQLDKEQNNARAALLKIISSLQFPAQQGLAIRGKRDEDGNFKQPLQLRGNDDENLRK